MPFRSVALLLSVLGLGLSVSGCRYDVIWTGVEFDTSGETIRLAAAEPLCGCLQITNISSGPVYIRSTVLGRELGGLNLPPNQATRIHFDWAGPTGREVYILDTWRPKGEQLNAREVLRIDDTGWPWQPCSGRLPGQPPPPMCEIGPLKLQTGRGQLR